ncbi:MAG: flavodoxin family protein [Desulfobacterales bacterium]|nr:MAG: flavodoxin family protein [Desulfobacterales bacterium]
MGTAGKVLGIVGSPNREGRTNQLVAAALDGAARGGASTESIQLADQVVAACKDCLPWVCKDKQKCTYEDEAFEYLSWKILNCGALVVGTPVYWWDTSGLVKYLILKMFRVYARSGPLQGLPAFGIAIAGGTGNGLVSGLRPVYHFFQMMQMRAIEPLPATRFNFDAAVVQAGKLGEELAALADRRRPFKNLEERLLWYDALPYLSLSRAAERNLLADLVIQALPASADPAIASGLARAQALAAAGKALESSIEVTRVYEAGAKAFEGQH